MTQRASVRDNAAVLAKTEAAQASAADPQASAWVNANAGTGKTHVLTLRVLRLLLAGTRPERILCLTYTKAAAAEMSKRVFDRLAEWVTADDATLAAALTKVLGRTPLIADMAHARTLFTGAIETPGGLKVQTIHAFCEHLLQRFPLEAAVPPGFKILDDEKGRELKARAIDATLTEATGAPDTPLGRALALTIRYAAESNFDSLLANAISERTWLTAASRLKLGAAAMAGDDFAEAERYLRQQFDIAKGATFATLQAEAAGVLSAAQVIELRDHLVSGTKSDINLAATLREVATASTDATRVDLLASLFLVSRGKSDEGPRDRLMTKALAAARPDLSGLISAAQTRFIEATGKLTALRLVEASAALYRLAGAVLQRYTDAKRAAGALDFEDLIEKTTSLLASESSATWVLFKLDGGLDHVLVDEAQDTSPEQWAIVEALAQEFFAGASAREGVRTLFGVGDEKQSIYSFQGAAPEEFARMGARFAALASSAGMPWRPIPLNLSFRTVQPVLDAVDAVFADPTRTPGLTAEPGAIQHHARRAGHSGTLELWPTEKPADSTSADPWDPLADSAERAPANRLAERIAELIGGWLNNGERLASENRLVRAGDILILVRKRAPFAVPMVAALKKRGIAVAGADRVTLTDQIAVQDLLVLGDFLTLPEDDLALATVLKGPLFGFNDDDLLTVAAGRKGALWKALLEHARGDARFRPAAEQLKHWRARADFMPPFEFYSELLERDGAREKMLLRLGPEAADAIDELLDIALTYDDSAPPSLTGFLADLRAAEREVKRDMEHGRDEVRVMTVHGAKGLEAPIVFLPDTCTTRQGSAAGARLMKLGHLPRPSGLPAPVVWAVKGTTRLAHLQTAKAAEDRSATAERNRLLYVAMTRARDRLYIAGFENKTGRDANCWYDVMSEALQPRLDKAELTCGLTGYRQETPQTAPAEPPRAAATAATEPLPPPPFAFNRAAAEPRLSVPLAPSRLEPYAPDDEGEPTDPAPRTNTDARDVPSPLVLSSDYRFLRGTLTHALLQHLPAIEPGARTAAATAFVDRRGAALPARTRASIVKETLAVLNAPGFAALFSAASMAEVPVSAVIPRPGGKGPALELSGQIDRLAVTDSEVLIVDFKTNRPPPQDVAKVAPAYIYQLAAYRLALRDIYAGRAVRAALLWTDGPRLMEIPAALLDAHETRLWTLDVARLDAS